MKIFGSLRLQVSCVSVRAQSSTATISLTPSPHKAPLPACLGSTDAAEKQLPGVLIKIRNIAGVAKVNWENNLA